MAIHLQRPLLRRSEAPLPQPPPPAPEPPPPEYHPPTREVVAGRKPKLRKLRNLFRKREL